MNDDSKQEPTNFEFTGQFLKTAKSHIKKYPKNRQSSAVMPLLDLAQRQNGGWIPKPAINYVANLLGMPSIRVLEVATFYTMYNLEPMGQFHVQVCTNLPCWLRGSNDVLNSCKKCLGIEIGETTDDNLFTLSEVECLGACVNAPMMQINDDYFEDLTSETTENILFNLREGAVVKAGSQIGRNSCEPINGLTSLQYTKSNPIAEDG